MYINKQRHRYTCGPVALANAYKSLGFSCSYDYILQNFRESLKWGSFFDEIHNHLRHNKVTCRYIKPRFSKMQKELDKGNGIILLFRWCDNRGGHFVFIDGYTDKYFIGYNYNTSGSKYISKRDLAKHFRYNYRNYSNYPRALVVR